MQGSHHFWDRSKVLVLVSLVVVLGVPFGFALTRDNVDTPSNAERLVIVTPHNEQIRFEFESAFSDWHESEYGTPVAIDWRQPGGTSEIRKQLVSQYTAAIRDGVIKPDGSLQAGQHMTFDLMFGGGSYEHDQLKQGVSTEVDGQTVSLPMSVPVSLAESELATIYGENAIGAGYLFDPDRYWVGTAVSGFGIIYNRDTLSEIGIDEPRSWGDLTDPRLTGWLALADARMSGSVTTTYDSILNRYGWDEGWRILQSMSANARYFSNSSSKIPVDVSQGEAAAGVAIDFYGRYQSQAVMREGETPETTRVGYIDPPGATYIDADPISKLRGAPNSEIADRFIRFVLSDSGQSLWQIPVSVATDDFGPEEYELRRMPVVRSIYASHGDRFVDAGIDPFTTAMDTPSRGWRSAVAPLMSAFGCDIHQEQVRAWRALSAVGAAAQAGEVSVEEFEELRRLFFEFPTHRFPDDYSDPELAGTGLLFNAENYRTIRGDWAGRRPRQETQIEYTTHFRRNYEEIVVRAEQLLP